MLADSNTRDVDPVNSPVEIVPDGCTPLFSVLGAPPKPLGVITGRVGNGVHGLSASLLPRERQDGLKGCSGRLMRLVVVGTSLKPLMISKASPAPSWHTSLARWAFGNSYMVPQFAAAKKPLDFLLPRVAAATSDTVPAIG